MASASRGATESSTARTVCTRPNAANKTSDAAARPHDSGLNVTVLGAVSLSHKRTRRVWRGSSRTVSMTRASNVVLSRTTRRSSRVTALRISSSLFGTLLGTMHLTQQLAKPLARPHDPHLERRHANPRELRHFVVA